MNPIQGIDLLERVIYSSLSVEGADTLAMVIG